MRFFAVFALVLAALGCNGATPGAASSSTASTTTSAPTGSGRFAYLATGSSIQEMSIATTGELTSLGTFSDPSLEPRCLAMDSNGRFLYVGGIAGAGGGTVASLAIDASTGKLSMASSIPFQGADTPLAIAPLEPGFIYVAGGSTTDVVTSVDETTGILGGGGTGVLVGASSAGLAPWGVAVVGSWIYSARTDASNATTLTVESLAGPAAVGLNVTSATVPVALPGSGPLIAGPSGNVLYAFANGAVAPYAVDPASGMLTAGTAFTLPGAGSLAFSPTAPLAFAITSASGGDQIAALSVGSSGALSLVSQAPVPPSATATWAEVVLDASGRFAYLLGVANGGCEVQACSVGASALAPVGPPISFAPGFLSNVTIFVTTP